MAISAVQAQISKQGFLDNSSSPYHEQSFKLDWPCPDGETGSVLLACIKRNAYLSNGPKETVDERAWVLQEELLSRRLLTFKSHSVMWKCRTCYHMDGGSTSPQGWSSWLPLGHNNMKDQSTQSPGSLAGNKAPVRQQDFYEACG